MSAVLMAIMFAIALLAANGCKRAARKTRTITALAAYQGHNCPLGGDMYGFAPLWERCVREEMLSQVDHVLKEESRDSIRAIWHVPPQQRFPSGGGIAFGSFTTRPRDSWTVAAENYVGVLAFGRGEFPDLGAESTMQFTHAIRLPYALVPDVRIFDVGSGDGAFVFLSYKCWRGVYGFDVYEWNRTSGDVDCVCSILTGEKWTPCYAFECGAEPKLIVFMPEAKAGIEPEMELLRKRMGIDVVKRVLE